MKKNILIFNPTIHEMGIKILQQEFNLVMCPSKEETMIIEYVNKYKIQGIVTRVEKITRNIFESCSSLKVIAQHGVGVDHIDVEAATENGVIILNVPDSNFSSVAEHTLMFMLALSRNILQTDQQVRKGNWNYREQFVPSEINGKTLFIVGLGTIGQELARKANAFHMNILSFDPAVSRQAMEVFGVEKVDDFNTGIKQADFITLHVPLNRYTHHLINEDVLNDMKPTAYIINVSRGSVMDEMALYNALKNRRIAGAGLDVMEQEPPEKNHLLYELDNVLFTPHTAGDTKEAKQRCATFLADDVVTCLKGNLPKNLLNKNVLRNSRLYYYN